MVTGSCLCGEIEFQITGKINPIQICHCQQCRKAQGGPLATNIPVNISNLNFVKGGEYLQEFESLTRKGKHRVFCRRCGSPILSKLDTAPAIVRVRAGTLDEPFSSRLALHQFVARKASWWTIDDELPQHDEYPPE